MHSNFGAHCGVTQVSMVSHEQGEADDVSEFWDAHNECSSISNNDLQLSPNRVHFDR